MKIFLISFFTLVSILFFNKNSNKNYQSITLQDDTLKESIKRGNKIYTDFCVTCHLPNGKGMANVFPPLANSDFLMEKQTESIRGIKYGMSGEITVNGKKYNGFMASMGLSNQEVADVMNYITNSWENKNDKIFTIEEVSEIKKIN
ncbi:cytochrome c [Flavobacteriaceae bacterium AH-315-B10]|nr:cytochrome c [Flavobacteriaceae bacterium AH-315-B10]